MGIMIGESSTFPTNIYLKVVAKKLRAMRLTNYEKLTLEEIKELSREILIQRKVNFYKRSIFLSRQSEAICAILMMRAARS